MPRKDPLILLYVTTISKIEPGPAYNGEVEICWDVPGNQHKNSRTAAEASRFVAKKGLTKQCINHATFGAFSSYDERRVAPE